VHFVIEKPVQTRDLHSVSHGFYIFIEPGSELRLRVTCGADRSDSQLVNLAVAVHSGQVGKNRCFANTRLEKLAHKKVRLCANKKTSIQLIIWRQPEAVDVFLTTADFMLACTWHVKTSRRHFHLHARFMNRM